MVICSNIPISLESNPFWVHFGFYFGSHLDNDGKPEKRSLTLSEKVTNVVRVLFHALAVFSLLDGALIPAAILYESCTYVASFFGCQKSPGGNSLADLQGKVCRIFLVFFPRILLLVDVGRVVYKHGGSQKLITSVQSYITTVHDVSAIIEQIFSNTEDLDSAPD